MDKIVIPDANTVDPNLVNVIYREKVGELTDQVLLRDAKIRELMTVCGQLQAQVTELDGALAVHQNQPDMAEPETAGGYPTRGRAYVDPAS